MALVNVVNMVVLDNPTAFVNPFQFEITFECLQMLEEDLEWKILYVGSANDKRQDQVLDEILVGPVPVGLNKFVLQADSPDITKLPPTEIIGVTVVLVTCSYREREFVRVGYYVNNEYLNWNEQEDGSPPAYPALDVTRIQRQILADKPRVTKFPINWGNNGGDEAQMSEQDAKEATNDDYHHHNDDDMQRMANDRYSSKLASPPPPALTIQQQQEASWSQGRAFGALGTPSTTDTSMDLY